MSNTNKISINKFETIMKEHYINSEDIQWNGITINIKKTLSLKDMMELVDMVVKSCFEKETNSYIPEIKDFAIKLYSLEKYTNFTLPKNISKQYDLIYCTDAYKIINNYINRDQFAEILIAIDEKINNITQSNISAINNQLTELYKQFEELQLHVSKLFSGIEENDIKLLTKAMSEGIFDENKIVEAYMNNKNNNGD